MNARDREQLAIHLNAARAAANQLNTEISRMVGVLISQYERRGLDVYGVGRRIQTLVDSLGELAEIPQ